LLTSTLKAFFYISIVSSRGRGNVEGLGNFKCACDDADDGWKREEKRAIEYIYIYIYTVYGIQYTQKGFASVFDAKLAKTQER